MKNFHRTIGSLASDDGYYIELRNEPTDSIPCISMQVNDDGIITIHFGGVDGIDLQLDELKLLLNECELELKKKKEDWDYTKELFGL